MVILFSEQLDTLEFYNQLLTSIRDKITDFDKLIFIAMTSWID